ncbi:alpha/beta fold hydrolase [Pseudomonas sp. NPDC078700]|uniref:alpha/beta fold hydrolase n=1 Tax=Pseudomonas sp. NPDC078700 TaxID=3364424 RepID=UPI0037C6F0D0
MKKILLALILVIAAAGTVLYVFPATLMASIQLIGQTVAGLSSKQLEVADLSIHYYEGGPKDGETILMVHGFGADKNNWLQFARYFTKRYHVIALDLPGFGDSSKPPASYDVGTQAERIAAFTQALGIKRLHIIGNSMGGQIAALYGARYPHQVASVALLDNAGIDAPHESELYRLIEQDKPNPLVVKTPQQFDQLIDFVFYKAPTLPERLKTYMAEQAIASSGLNEQIFSQLRDRYIPLEPELPKIEAPTLLLWGDQDRVLDVSSIKVMQPLLKHPSVVVMKDCGHVPMVERPAETAEHYQAFLDTVAQTLSKHKT